MERRLIDKVNDLVDAHGIDTTLAALCQIANERGMKTLFNKLNRVYEWLKV